MLGAEATAEVLARGRLAEASRGVPEADRGVVVERDGDLEQLGVSFGADGGTEHDLAATAVTPLTADQARALAAELIAAAEESEAAGN